MESDPVVERFAGLDAGPESHISKASFKVKRCGVDH